MASAIFCWGGPAVLRSNDWWRPTACRRVWLSTGKPPVDFETKQPEFDEFRSHLDSSHLVKLKLSQRHRSWSSPGVIFGGVAAQQQTPHAGEPDFGRWPEVLVATPGRLLELISVKRWISAKRISYVVLDEADHMLSTGNWLIHIKELLKLMRPDRCLAEKNR